MDLYIAPNILVDVYTYMWCYDLQRYDIPEYMWASFRDYYCEDIEFKEKYIKYKENFKLQSTKQTLLFTINHLMACVINGYASQIPQILLKDKQFISIASHYTGYVLEFAPVELKTNIPFIMTVINKPSAIEYLDVSIRSNRQLATQIVVKYPPYLQYFNDDLKADRNFALDMIKRSPTILKYLHETLQSDPEIISLVLDELTTYLGFLELDEAFMHKLITNNPNAIKDLDAEWKLNRIFALKIIRRYESYWGDFDETLRGDRSLVLEIVEHNKLIFAYLDNIFKNDPEIALIATIYFDNWRHVGFILRENPEWMLKAIEQNPETYDRAEMNLKRNSQFVLSAAKLGAMVLSSLYVDIYDDMNFVREVFMNEKWLLDHK